MKRKKKDKMCPPKISLDCTVQSQILGYLSLYIILFGWGGEKEVLVIFRQSILPAIQNDFQINKKQQITIESLTQFEKGSLVIESCKFRLTYGQSEGMKAAVMFQTCTSVQKVSIGQNRELIV